MLKKTHDSLGRQLRYSPASTGKYVELTRANWAVGETLNDHPVLPITYLYEFQKHTRRNYTWFQKCIRDLARETNTDHGGRYLHRIKYNLRAREADNRPLSYQLTSHFQAALDARGIEVYKHTDQLPHRFMRSTCTASLRLGAMQSPITFLTRAEIKAHPKFPPSTRYSKSPFTIPLSDGFIRPDEIMGFGYPAGTYRFGVLEADKGTEFIQSMDAHNSFGHKLVGYIEVLTRKLHVERWGIPNLYILTVTTSEKRMQNMIAFLEHLTEQNPRLRKFFLFRHKSEFTEQWNVPPIMYDLFTDPWIRAGNEQPFFLNRE